MKHFLRVIKLSLVNKWTIALLMANSLLIGVLWGGSITAVYPFVEVVFSGNTIETWLAAEIKKSGESIASLNVECAEIRQQIEDEGRTSKLNNLLADRTKRLTAEEKANQLYSSIQPYVAGRVPKTPFGTLVLVMGLLIVMTIIKGFCLILNAVLVARVAQRTALLMRKQFYSAAIKMDQLEIDRKGTSAMQTMLVYNLNLVTAGLTGLYVML